MSPISRQGSSGFLLKLFGAASVEGPDGPLRGRAVQRRRLALLALLAWAGDRGVTREKLVGYLWPDADPERARRLLSDSIYRINQAVEGDAVVAIGDELRLDPRRLPSDVWRFREAMDQEEWERAVDLQAAPFLDGFYLPDCIELERWVDTRRDHLSRERAKALEALAEAAEAAGERRRAAHWWALLASHDPYNSRVALRRARALDRMGDPAAALKHAREHARMLEEDIGVSPPRELLAFVEQLARPPSASGEARTVAVLPFDVVGDVQKEDYFAEGMAESLIAQLAKVGAINVISRASAMRFKNSTASHGEIAAALGASDLLIGTVRRSGERVRVTVELMVAASGRCVWAESYERRLTDVFDIQADVSLQVASALRAKLSADERGRITSATPTRSVEAYQSYLRGRHWLLRFSPEGVQRSIEYFERAIALDPGYALAHANLAMAYEELVASGAADPSETLAKAFAAAHAALAADDTLAEAHCVLGQLKAVRDFDWEGAETEFERALELSPGSADTYDLYGRMCGALCRHEESVEMQKRALELDPLAHRTDFATALIRAGRYDEAVSAASSAVEFDPGYARARATLGWALIKTDRPVEGVAELEVAVSQTPHGTAWVAQLGQAYAVTGRTEDAVRIVDGLEERARREYVSPYHLAYPYTGLGWHDRAIDALELAWKHRAGPIYGVKGSFLFTALHPHPRFVALLERMNL